MNTSELEQRMRELLEEEEYHPPATAWNKLKEELQPPASPARTVFLLPAWKAAAAVVLFLGLAATGYLFLRQTPSAPATGTGNIAHIPQASPAVRQETKKTPEAIAGLQQARRPHATVKSPAAPSIARNAAAAQLPATQPKEVEHTPIPEKQATPPVAQINQPVPAVPGAHTNPTGHTSPLQSWEPATEKDHRFKLGIAANVGKPSLGDYQYNVGVVARQPLGDKFFAEATVALASTQVGYSERITAPGKTGSIGSGDGMSNVSATDARYASNILSVGIAPAIGFKATKNLSVSLGGDLYKSLNRTLALQQDMGQLDKAGYTMVTPDKNVTDWDAGVKAQADYRLGRKLSLNMQYRQGLTRFILIEDKSIKNSAFNIGLKYYIGR